MGESGGGIAYVLLGELDDAREIRCRCAVQHVVGKLIDALVGTVVMIVVMLMLMRAVCLIPRRCERVGQRLPSLLACRHLFGRQQARLQLRSCSITVELAADAHKLRAPIAVLIVPRVPARRILLGGLQISLNLLRQLFGPLRARDGRDPRRPRRHRKLRARQRRVPLLLGARRQPREALEAKEPT